MFYCLWDKLVQLRVTDCQIVKGLEVSWVQLTSRHQFISTWTGCIILYLNRSLPYKKSKVVLLVYFQLVIKYSYHSLRLGLSGGCEQHVQIFDQCFVKTYQISIPKFHLSSNFRKSQRFQIQFKSCICQSKFLLM